MEKGGILAITLYVQVTIVTNMNRGGPNEKTSYYFISVCIAG